MNTSFLHLICHSAGFINTQQKMAVGGRVKIWRSLARKNREFTGMTESKGEIIICHT